MSSVAVMSRTDDLGPPHDVVETSKCKQELWLPRPHVIYVRQRGHLDEDVARAMARVCERAIAGGRRLSGFVDALDVGGYTPEHRRVMTAWIQQALPHIDGMHVLTRSKLVAMGISVANLALGGSIRAHATRATFDAELAHALR